MRAMQFYTVLFILFALQRSIVYPLSEKEILLEFKGNITDDPFDSLSSWDPSPAYDQCSNFSGILCDSSGNVKKIVLNEKKLSGILSASLSGLKSLRIVSLFGNRFTGNIPVEFAQIGTLRKLNLSQNDLSGNIPDFVGDLSLRLLDLSMNKFSGEIPFKIFKNCFRMKFFSLSHNNLSGPIPFSLQNCSNLLGFDLSFNNLNGSFPSQICGSSNVAFVSLRNNILTGNVQNYLSVCTNLEYLDLGNNFFTGSPPFDVLGLKNISYLNASFNQFQGEFTEIASCGDRLEILDASGNSIGGKINPSITKCRNIRFLNLASNELKGAIPTEIGNLKKLSVLILGNNIIDGRIPSEIGSIELLQILDLHNLHLIGEIPSEISSCRFLLQLDLSGNNLEGEIPQTLYNATYLKNLDLHLNRLNGSIPLSLGELSRIQFLDLSENFFTGSIPSSLGNLTLLTYLNVSFNNLTGAIPTSPFLQKFGPTAFFHNPGLCGPPLDVPCLENRGIESKSGRAKLLSVSALVAIIAASVILVGVFVVTCMNVKAYKKEEKDKTVVLESSSMTTPPQSNVIIGKLVLFSKNLPSKYEEWEAGTKALLDKDCLIGGGSIGTMYRVNFEVGISIAVKKLETLGRIKNQEDFEQEIGRLGNLHHPNLVTFHGYYYSSAMQLILTEYVPNGNLYQHLHVSVYSDKASTSGESFLSWSRRFRIACGVARSLSYLHHDCKPQILHLNIKSTNILLDEEYNGKLSDYGLVKLLPMLDGNFQTKFHTSIGYVAPELACESFRFSNKCDVFSFGVILLELVTGKKPVERSSTRNIVVLSDYVRRMVELGVASDCFDRSLYGSAENELIQVMKLGLICTSENPASRPRMAEVVQILESIKPVSD